MSKILIIDPTSPEVNRGSFCYLPYILYAHYDKEGFRVDLKEEFRFADMESIDYSEYDAVRIALWSYPQVEQALMFFRFIDHPNVKFFGYKPLIKRMGLPMLELCDKIILDGLAHYPFIQDRFKYVLLSDCDKHIREEVTRLDTGNDKLRPIFTSYGCPMGCKFCSATVNQRKRIVLPLDSVERIIAHLRRRQCLGIHFTDEDFFFDAERAYNILYTAWKHGDFEIIALASVDSFFKFLEYAEHQVNPEEVKRVFSVLKLVEIGLESGDTDLANRMGKKRTQDKTPQHLAENSPVPILWLTMTFHPGESANTIWWTGRFLEKYGLSTDKLVDRIVTNGTVGGLGQFFQYYHGTGMDEGELTAHGLVLTERPMRLIPSFIPDSFLNSVIAIDYRSFLEKRIELEYWCSIYKIQTPKWFDHMNTEIDSGIEGHWNQWIQIRNLVSNIWNPSTLDLQHKVPYNTLINNAIFVALLLRLDIAKP